MLILTASTYTVDIADTGFATISHDIIITASEPLESFSYYLPFPISHLDVYADKTVSGEYTVLGEETVVTLYVSLKEGESAFCICEYVSWDIISKDGSQWWVYLPAMESVTIVMPEGAEISYLVTESDFPSVSEEKGRIYLFWEYLSHNVYVYYVLGVADTGGEWWYWLAGLAGLAGLAAGLWYTFKSPSKTLNKDILSILNEREKGIVIYLNEHGRSRQAKISRALNIPKTSLSKILIRMEERTIIKRERDGNMTFCELDEQVYQ